MTDVKRTILDRYREVNQLLRLAYWAKDRDCGEKCINYSRKLKIFMKN